MWLKPFSFFSQRLVAKFQLRLEKKGSPTSKDVTLRTGRFASLERLVPHYCSMQNKLISQKLPGLGVGVWVCNCYVMYIPSVSLKIRIFSPIGLSFYNINLTQIWSKLKSICYYLQLMLLNKIIPFKCCTALFCYLKAPV